MRNRFSLLALALMTLFVAACDTTSNRTIIDTDVYVTEVDFNVASATLNGTVLSQQFAVPAIDNNAAAVLAYFYEQGTWTAMPYTYAVDDAQLQAVSYTISLGHAFSNQTFEAFYESSAADVNLRQQPSRRIRVVVLGDYAAKQNVDFSDYNAVKAAFHLPD